MALRECDTFFFGTANTTEGNNSRREFHDGIARLKGANSAAGRKNVHASMGRGKR